jgi:multidrug resistance protein
MQLVFAPVWGRISDHVGRRPVLLVSLVGSVVGYVLLAAASSLAMLFVARLVAGVAGANIPVAQAYIADVTTPAERTRGMGLIGAAFGLGMVIGPAIGGALSLVGPRVPETFAAGLCLVNLVVAAWVLPESLGKTERRGSGFRHPLARASLRAVGTRPGAASLLAMFFLVTLAFAILEGTFSLAAAHRHGYGAALVALLWLYMGTVAVVVQGWLIGVLARRWPDRTLVASGIVALASGLLWTPFAGGPVALCAALGLVVLGQGLSGPALSSLISRTVEADAHGEALGVSQSLSAGARVLGPAGGGFVFHRLGADAPFIVAAACAAGVLGILLRGDAVPVAAGSPRFRRSG